MSFDLSILKAADENLDGRISRREFVNVLIKSGMSPAKAESNAGDFLSAFDKYQTGSIRINDFIDEYTRMICFQVARGIKSGKIAGIDRDNIDRKSLEQALAARVGSEHAAIVTDKLFSFASGSDDSKTSSSLSSETTLSLDQLNQWYRKIAATTRTNLERNTAQCVDDAFKAFDVDDSGFIELDEFQLLCESLNIVMDEDQCLEALQSVDTSNDDKLSKEEFKRFLQLRDSGAINTGQVTEAMSSLRAKILVKRGEHFFKKMKDDSEAACNKLRIQTTFLDDFDEKKLKASVELKWAEEHLLDQGTRDLLVKNLRNPEATAIQYIAIDLSVKEKTMDDIKQAMEGLAAEIADTFQQINDRIEFLPIFVPAESKDQQACVRFIFSKEPYSAARDDELQIGRSMLQGHKLELSSSISDILAGVDKLTLRDLFGLRLTSSFQLKNKAMHELSSVLKRGFEDQLDKMPLVSDFLKFASDDAAAARTSPMDSPHEIKGNAGPEFEAFLKIIFKEMRLLDKVPSTCPSVFDVPLLELFDTFHDSRPDKREKGAKYHLPDRHVDMPAFLVVKALCRFFEIHFDHVKAIHGRVGSGQGFDLTLDNVISIADVRTALSKLCFRYGVPQKCSSAGCGHYSSSRFYKDDMTQCAGMTDKDGNKINCECLLCYDCSKKTPAGQVPRCRTCVRKTK